MKQKNFEIKSNHKNFKYFLQSMDNSNFRDVERDLPNISSSRSSFDQEDLFISIYRREKISFFYTELIMRKA